MKRIKWHLPLFALTVTGSLVGVALVIAGPLDPPAGPVAPTYKTLSDVEPRIAIKQSMIPLAITDRGSYYLAENISFTPLQGNAITVQVGAGGLRSTVSIDLNGFEIRQIGTPNPNGTRAIQVNGDDQGGSTIVRNGFITGFNAGVYGNGYGLNVQNVGFGSNIVGVYSLGACVVSHCTFHRGQRGVYVESVPPQGSGTFPGGALIANCTAQLVDDGFYAGTGTTITDCEVYDHFGIGFQLGDGCTIRNCGVGGGSYGIRAGFSNVIVGNRVVGAGVDNIYVVGNNRIEDNTVVGDGPQTPGTIVVGLRTTGANNYVSGNTVRNCYNNTTLNNYNIAGTTNQLNLLLTELPQTISWPATVTLAGDLVGITGQGGITVASDNVTIDLGGHAMRGVAGSIDGISVPAVRRNLVVKNGTVTGWGSSGIYASTSVTARYENIVLLGNGQQGLYAGHDTIIRSCQAVSNTAIGILAGNRAHIIDCAVSGNTTGGLSLGQDCRVDGCFVGNNSAGGINAGAHAQISNCTVSSNVANGIVLGSESRATDCISNFNALGISVADGCQVLRCDATNNSTQGILAGNGNQIMDCNVRANGGDGIRVNFSCLVSGNNLNGNGAAGGTQGGINVLGRQNKIIGNHLSFEDIGIMVSGTRNMIAQNTLGECGSAFSMVAGNSHGPLVSVVGVGDITATAGANHPQANFIE